MPRPQRTAKKLTEDVDDDPFSGSEDTPDTEFSESEEEIVPKKKKSKAKKTPAPRDEFSSTDEDEPLNKVVTTKTAPSATSRKSKNPVVASKLDIAPLTEEELKEKYKYRKHGCKMSTISTKRQISGLDFCRPGHPAEMSVDKVKLHYVVHYIYRGIWDHIVPEEGDQKGKIDSYLCNLCANKRFKNDLENQEYPGRGSALCHVATDHGRLLQAMLNDTECDMSEEIRSLAKYDKQFNDTLRAHLDHGDNCFGMADEEIISTKESLVWSIYEKKNKQKAAEKKKLEESKPKKEESKTTKDEVVKKSPVKISLLTSSKVDEETQPLIPKPQDDKTKYEELLKRPKPKNFKCPFDGFDACGTRYQEAQAFRLHFFKHYVEKWTERINALVKGDKVYYCDICPSKKPCRGASDEGARNAAICHLAIQHHELRGMMKSDSRITSDFICDVYLDVDLKNLGKGEEKVVAAKPPTPKMQVKPAAAIKAAPSIKKAGAKSKTKKAKALEQFSSEDDDDSIPDLSDSDKEAKTEKKESPVVSSKTPTSYIRKRKPLNLTMADLEPESEDENWDDNRRKSSDRGRKRKLDDGYPIPNNRPKSRILPKRKAAAAKKAEEDDGQFSSESE